MLRDKLWVFVSGISPPLGSVRIVKNCDLGLEKHFQTSVTVFHYAASGSIFKTSVTVFHYTDLPAGK